jgi:hypothetical protein
MPRKSRRSRRVHRDQTIPRPAASVAVKEPEQPIAAGVRQAPVRKPVQSGPDLNQQSQRLRSDIRRILGSAGICVAVTIGLWLLLR